MDNPSKIKEVPEGQYLKISFGYDMDFLLPYDDGITFMETMKNALAYHSPYKKEHFLSQLDKYPTIQITNAVIIKEQFIKSDLEWKEKQATDLLQGKTNGSNT